MFELVPFKQRHISEMLTQEINRDAREFFAHVDLTFVEQLPSFSGIVKGKPAVCGGVIPYWNRRGYLWTIFDEGSKECFLPVFRGIKAFLEQLRPAYNRLEIAVPCDFRVGIRRAKMLGFEVECERAVKFFPDGKDASLLVLFGGS